VLILLLIFVVSAASFTVLLWAGTLFFQSYIYTEPTKGIHWQAPAAGGALAAFLTLWCLLVANDVASPDSFVFQFSPRVDKYNNTVKDLWAVRKGAKEAVHYRLKKNPPGTRPPHEYVEANLATKRWRNSGTVEAIIIKEGKENITFWRLPHTKSDLYYQYQDGDGWIMRDYDDGNGPDGTPSMFRWGRFLLNLFLNLLHLALWWACLWLLLRFQWGHALGFALVIWLVLTLLILPMVFAQAGELARQSARLAGWITSMPGCA